MKKLTALWTGIGAAIMYFLDPQQGRRRRATVRDRGLSFFRQGGRRAERMGRGVASQTVGIAHKARHIREEEKDFDDTTLARKVESEIFRDADAPKGQVDVNVVDGVVYLRGELEEPELIEALAEKTRKVSGVKGVENLLHTPGTPAPTTPEGS